MVKLDHEMQLAAPVRTNIMTVRNGSGSYYTQKNAQRWTLFLNDMLRFSVFALTQVAHSVDTEKT